MNNKIYTKKEKAMFNKDAEPIESSATDPNFGKNPTSPETPQQGDWEKEFEDYWRLILRLKDDESMDWEGTELEIKKFICQLLQKEREETLKSVLKKEMKVEMEDVTEPEVEYYKRGFNFFRSQIIKTAQEKFGINL